MLASNIYNAGGNVGIGTTNPNNKIQVVDLINFGNNSTIIGYQAGYNNTGTHNIFSGYQAGYNNTGTYNIGLGFQSGYNTTGCCNVFLGHLTGNSNSSGHMNIFIGYEAGRGNTTGHDNIYLGCATGGYNNGGSNNILMGNNAGTYNTGNGNINIGLEANCFNQGGSNNTIIGCQAGRNTGYHYKSGNVFLGYQAGYYESGSNRLYIENSNSSTPLIYGEFDNDILTINGNIGIGTTLPTSKLQVVGLPEYANNAAAITAGLTVGAFYRTGDILKVVH